VAPEGFELVGVVEYWGLTPPAAPPEGEEEPADPPSPTSGPEPVIRPGATDDQDGTVLALFVSAVVILVSTALKLVASDGIPDCSPDSAV